VVEAGSASAIEPIILLSFHWHEWRYKVGVDFVCEDVQRLMKFVDRSTLSRIPLTILHFSPYSVKNLEYLRQILAYFFLHACLLPSWWLLWCRATALKNRSGAIRESPSHIGGVNPTASTASGDPIIRVG
jgi:hypothetical protein